MTFIFKVGSICETNLHRAILKRKFSQPKRLAMIAAGLALAGPLRVKKSCVTKDLPRANVHSWTNAADLAGRLDCFPCLSGLSAGAARGFVWDDNAWTTEIIGLLRDPSGLRLIWFQPTALQQYYPLSGTTFWLDYQLWKFWTTPYHVENVLLHTLAALLFWRLLLRLQVPAPGWPVPSSHFIRSWSNPSPGSLNARTCSRWFFTSAHCWPMDSMPRG